MSYYNDPEVIDESTSDSMQIYLNGTHQCIENEWMGCLVLAKQWHLTKKSKSAAQSEHYYLIFTWRSFFKMSTIHTIQHS